MADGYRETGDDLEDPLVAPEQGGRAGRESQELGCDIGRDGGRLSAQASAVHIEPG